MCSILSDHACNFLLGNGSFPFLNNFIMGGWRVASVGYVSLQWYRVVLQYIDIVLVGVLHELTILISEGYFLYEELRLLLVDFYLSGFAHSCTFPSLFLPPSDQLCDDSSCNATPLLC